MPILQRVELYIVLVYLLLMIGIGLFVAKRNAGGVDFFAAGRAVPWWVSGISLYMGNFSAWLFTGGAGMIYRATWYGILYFLLTGAVGYFLGAQLTAVQWRRSRVISPVEYTRARFGVGTQQLLALIVVVTFVAAAGNQLRAIASVVEGILQIPVIPAAVGIGVIVILYTLIGGLWAVMVTDVLQFVVLLAVTLLIAPLALQLVEGGLPTVLAHMELTIPPPHGPPDHNTHFLIAGLISVTLGVASGQGPRFFCVPDERSARKVGQLAAALFLTTPVLFSLPSLVARTIWGGPEQLALRIPGQNPHEQVFIEIAKEVLPPGLVGVFLAAMFAATMSALDTVYNYVASILSRDVYMHFRPDTDDRALLRVGRVATVATGTVVIGLCLWYVHGTGDLFKVMTDIFFLSAPIVSVPVALGLLFRKAPRSAGMCCMLAGIAAGLFTKVWLRWPTGPQVYLTQGVCIAIFLLSPWLAARWRRKKLLARLLLAGGAFVVLYASLRWQSPGAAVHLSIIAFSALLAGATLLFARTFAAPEDRSEVDRFYRILDTPVDVAAEVTGTVEAALGVYRLVGILTYVIAGLVLVMMAVEQVAPPATGAEPGKYLALTGILAALGTLFFLAGRRARPDADPL